MTKVANLIIMGEAPGNYPRYDPKKHALYPHPPHCAGARLCNLMGMFRKEYIALERRNLFDYYPGKLVKGAKFPAGAARQAVQALHESHVLIGYNVLIMGMRLAKAFGYDHYPILTWHHQKLFNFAVVPHTSGINHWWNIPENKSAGRAFLYRVAEQARAGELSFN